MSIRQFRRGEIPPAAEQLRADVRAFLSSALRDMPAVERAESWMGFDPAFSTELAKRGWLGMAVPRRYGGRELGPFARYVVSEELLAAGAPVSAHWFGDRQTAPMLLRFGSESQRQRYLPSICRATKFFCLGMSEPNSGSDLASIGTRAMRVTGGWSLTGRKIWTTNAHRSHYMVALARTGDRTDDRHDGMSQFIIDLALPGITIRPIRDLTGNAHFNEVFFDEVHLPEDALIGQEGSGWEQVTAELAFERSGPERFLSSMVLLLSLIRTIGSSPDAYQAREIGRLVARLCTLRNMSLAVTAQLEAGESPTWAASVVKDLGASLEQDIPEIAHNLLEVMPSTGGDGLHAAVLGKLIQLAPSFSIRGGTREILRGIIARGLGVR